MLKEEEIILMVSEVILIIKDCLHCIAMTGSSQAGEEIEDLLCLDLTHEEIKAAFR